MSRAVRFGLAAIVFGLSYPNVHCAIHIDKFQQIYADMLGNKPLPALTVFIIHYHWLFVASSIVFPVAAFLTVFVPGVTRSIYISGFLVIATFVQLFFQWHALTGPLFSIIQGMAPAQQ